MFIVVVELGFETVKYLPHNLLLVFFVGTVGAVEAEQAPVVADVLPHPLSEDLPPYTPPENSK